MKVTRLTGEGKKNRHITPRPGREGRDNLGVGGREWTERKNLREDTGRKGTGPIFKIE